MNTAFYVVATLAAMIILYCIVSLAYMKRRKNAYLAMQDELRVGKQALVCNAIYGKVVALDKETVRLEIAPGVVISADRAAVFCCPEELEKK